LASSGRASKEDQFDIDMPGSPVDVFDFKPPDLQDHIPGVSELSEIGKVALLC
jgi:hypothetical protein